MLVTAQPTDLTTTSERKYTRVARQRKVLDGYVEKLGKIDESCVIQGLKKIDLPSSVQSLSAKVAVVEKEELLVNTVTPQKESVVEEAATVAAVVTSEEEEEEEVVKNVYYEQFNHRGMLMREPIPKQFVPNMDRPAPWYADSIPVDILEAAKDVYGLNDESFDMSQKGLHAKYVPYDWAKVTWDALLFISTHKWKPGIDNVEDLPALFQSIFATFFVDVYDELGRLINWKTVACVAHLTRLLPTAECYVITEDMFSGPFGIKEYDFQNWKLKDEHIIRMAAVSQITGDSLNAVCTLDLLMRFKRFTLLRNMCVTSFEKETLNDTLVFVSFMGENEKIAYAWVQIGLYPKSVSKLQKEQMEGTAMGMVNGRKGTGYYDGPFCGKCFRHHLLAPLVYCKICTKIMYCSAKCKKADRVEHNKTCISARLGQ